jgi:amino acid transporter
VASRFAEPGGPYLYAREAFGAFVGVEAGWLSLCSRVASTGSNLDVFADHLAHIVPAAGEPAARALTIIAVTALVTAINVAGVRLGARTVDLLTVAKVTPLVLLIVLGLPHLDRAALASQSVAAPDWTHAMLLLVTAYAGFEAALIPAGEQKDPRRDSPFALLAGMGAVIVLYVLVQLTVVGTLPRAALSKTPVAAAVGLWLGPWGVAGFAVAALVSTFGWTVGSVLNTPRILYSMGERGEAPAWLARVHPRFRTPYVAIVVYAAAGCAFAIGGSFAANATLTAVTRCVTYALTAAALLVFRRDPAPPRFRVPLAAIVAPLAIAGCLWLLIARALTQAWIVVAILASGALLWWVSARGRGRR